MPALPLVLVLLVSMRGWAVEGRPTGESLMGEEFLRVFMRSIPRPTTDHYYSNNDVFNGQELDGSSYRRDSPKLADLQLGGDYEETETTATTTTVAPQEGTTEEVGPTTTTDEGATAAKVVEVRVSSSVVRAPPPAAAGRSHLGVDEASAAVSFAAPTGDDEDKAPTYGASARSDGGGNIGYGAPRREDEVKAVSYSAEHTVYRVEGRRVADSLAAASQRYGIGPGHASRGYGDSPTGDPVSYQTSVSTATSGGGSRYYRPPPSPTPLSAPPPPPPPPPPPGSWQEPERVYGEPERNYEVDEAVSVGTRGRAHGPQDAPSDPHKNKFVTVVEEDNVRKYRVEEKTPDGFIVGEYGVVSHHDGSTRGVRYTAQPDISPRLIYEALIRFLSLK